MKMNVKMFNKLKNPVEVIEVEGKQVEIYFMNDTEYLAQYAGQGYFFVWSSDGKSYKLLVEKGYYETLDELFLPEVNAYQIELYEDLSKSRKKIYTGLVLPVFLIIVGLLVASYFVEEIKAYTMQIAIGGLLVFLIVNILQSSILKRKVNKLRNNYFNNLEQFFGAEKLEDLVHRQREYHAAYFNFDVDDEELEEEVLKEVDSEEKEEEPQAVPLWISENKKQEEQVAKEPLEEQEEEIVKEPEKVVQPKEEVEKPKKEDKPVQEPTLKEADLSILTVEELKEFAKERKIAGFSSMRKSEVVEALPSKYEKLRVVELQALARELEIPNFSTMRKNELIEAIKNPPVKELEEEKELVLIERRVQVVKPDGTTDLTVLTVEELKEFAQDRKISGYSTMRKAELLEALPTNIHDLRLVELRALGKAYEINNFSIMRKQELLDELLLGAIVYEEAHEELPKEPKKEMPKKEMPKKEKEVKTDENRIQVVEKDGTVDLNVLIVEELKEFAKDRKVAGYSTMRKQELVEALPNNIEELRLVELKALGRAHELNNFSIMRKEELIEELKLGILVVEEKEEVIENVPLISVLNEDGTANLNLLNLEELKEFAKDRKVSGYSTMRKAELVEALPREIKDLRTVELKALARVRKVPNFSTMRKQELLDALK